MLQLDVFNYRKRFVCILSVRHEKQASQAPQGKPSLETWCLAGVRVGGTMRKWKVESGKWKVECEIQIKLDEIWQTTTIMMMKMN